MLFRLSTVIFLALILVSWPLYGVATESGKTVTQTDTVTQSFQLTGRDKFGFAFGLTQPGPVTVKLEWQGSPLMIKVADGKGKPVLEKSNCSSPGVTLNFTATDTQLTGGTIWGGLITPSSPSTATTVIATGRLTLITPKVDRAKLNSPTLKTAKFPRELLESARTTSDTRLQARIRTFDQERATLRATALTQATTRIRAIAQSSQTMQTTRRTEISREQTTAFQMTVRDPETPVITACSIREGGPGDSVILTGQRLQGSVHLKLSDQQQVTVAGAVGNADGTEMRFALPNYALSAWTRASLYVKRRVGGTNQGGVPIGGTTYTSNNVPIWVMPTVPSITEILPKGADPNAPAETGPNTSIVITGVGFDPRGQGEVHVKFSATDDRIVRAEEWGEAQVKAIIPELSPFVDPINAQVYVKCFGYASTPKPLVIRPDMEVRVLEFRDCRLDSNIITPLNTHSGVDMMDDALERTCLSVMHLHGSPITFCLTSFGDDEIYRSKRLKNGWVVDSVDVTPIGQVGGFFDAYVIENRTGTDSPFVKVHWWSTPINMTPIMAGPATVGYFVIFAPVVYQLRMTVKGPKGTSYW